VNATKIVAAFVETSSARPMTGRCCYGRGRVLAGDKNSLVLLHAKLQTAAAASHTKRSPKFPQRPTMRIWISLT